VTLSKLTLAIAAVMAPQAAPADGNRPHVPPVLALRPAAAAGEYELLIYGDIGESWWGDSVTAQSVVEQLNQLDAAVATINVRINSYGGSVADGLAIYNALKRHPAAKAVTVDGVAMSSASLIAMAGDTVHMPATSILMIHAPWGGLMGNAQELRRYADVLDTFADAMVDAYVAKSGKDRTDMLAMLKDGQDHYYTGTQAVAEGFADAVVTVAQDEPDEQSRALGKDLLNRYAASFSRAPEGIAEMAVAAVLRARVPAAATPGSALSPTPANGPAATTEDDDMRTQGNAAGPSNPNPAAGGGNPAPANPTNPTPTEIAAAAVDAIRARNDRIHAALSDVMGQPAIAELYQAALRDPTMTVEAVQARALTVLGAQASPANGGAGRVEGGEDQRDKFIAGASRALAARAGLETRETGNEFNGMRLTELAAVSMQRSGITTRGMSADQIARRVLAVHTSGDFPLLLANTAGRSLRAGYEAYPSTYQMWCGVGSVSDFKAHSRIQLGSFNSLATIPEGGEYTYGTMSEEAESITAATKGKGLKLTRQMLVNDDLGGFLRRGQMLGRAAARTVNNDVYAYLTSGASNNGPTMSDTGQLFNATAITTAGGHANYLASGYAPTTASIAAGRAAMRKQKDKGLHDSLDIQPRYILAPVALEDVAWAVLNSTADPASANSNKKNFVRDVANLTLVTDPYLDGISATAWYLAADPNDVPLIEVAFLDGQQTPFIDEEVDFDSDAMKFKVRLDYGVAAIDWRAGYRTTGTGGS
jgi:ATP-dependent protease ClpP protease subunit/phage major head subunit gpT-like protein